MLLTGFLTFASVATFTFLQQPAYESAVTFLIDRRANSTSDALDVLQRLGRPSSVASEIGVMSGRRVAAEVVDALQLRVRLGGDHGRHRPAELLTGLEVADEAASGRYTLRHGERDRTEWLSVSSDQGPAQMVASGPVGAQLSHEGIRFVAPRLEPGAVISFDVVHHTEAVEWVVGSFEAQPVGENAEFVRLRCRGPSPELAREICAEASDSYLAFRSDLQRVEASGAGAELAAQAESVDVQLSAAEDSLRRFEAENQLVAAQERASEGVRQVARLQAELMEKDSERRALAALLTSIEREGGGSAPYRELASFPTFIVSQNNAVGRLLETLVDLEDQRAQLRVRRSADNVDVLSLQARIEATEGQLGTLAKNYKASLDIEAESLSEAIAQSQLGLDQIPGKQVELARRSRQVELLADLKRFLEQRRYEAQVAQMVELPSVRLVDPAYLPFESSSPNLPLNLGVGVLLSLIAAAMVGLFREESDTSVRERTDLSEISGLPVLGLVPHLGNGGPVCQIDERGGGDASSGTSRALDPLVPAPEAISALEAFRSLVGDLRSLAARSASGHFSTLAIVSPMRGDGKTFTACNLAIAHASLGVNTLLVDTDERARGVARFFGCEPEAPGLMELLAGAAPTPRLQHWRVKGRGKLSVLASGRSGERGAELMDDDRFDEFLEQARKRFGVVILDTPPANLLLECVAVAKRVDAVIFVTREGETSRYDISAALERLRRAEANVVGVVLNDSRLPGYGRYYAYPTY